MDGQFQNIIEPIRHNHFQLEKLQLHSLYGYSAEKNKEKKKV
jgi:hypothetical protein